jgi:hypothetical protein
MRLDLETLAVKRLVSGENYSAGKILTSTTGLYWRADEATRIRSLPFGLDEPVTVLTSTLTIPAYSVRGDRIAWLARETETRATVNLLDLKSQRRVSRSLDLMGVLEIVLDGSGNIIVSSMEQENVGCRLRGCQQGRLTSWEPDTNQVRVIARNADYRYHDLIHRAGALWFSDTSRVFRMEHGGQPEVVVSGVAWNSWLVESADGLTFASVDSIVRPRGDRVLLLRVPE